MFKRRLFISFKFNFKLWKSVLDWTIFAYLFIPSVVIGGFLYRDFVMNRQSATFEPLIFLIGLFVLSFVLTKPTLRLFLYEADLLFYRQNALKIRILKKHASLYAFITYSIGLLLLIGLLAPVLLVIGLTILDLCKLFAVLHLLSTLRILISYKIPKSFIRLPIQFCMHALIIFPFLYVPVIGYLVFWVIFVGALWREIQSNRHWNREVTWEYEAFYKWMKFVYQLSKEMRYYLPAKTKQPYITFGKKRTFSRYRIDNLVYKTLLRKLNYISLPFRLITLGIGLLLILPVWAKVIVLAIVTAGLFSAVDSILKEIKQAPFFHLMPVAEEEWLATKKRLQIRTVYPIIMLLLILFILI